MYLLKTLFFLILLSGHSVNTHQRAKTGPVVRALGDDEANEC